ncbi:MAG: hypothetical protein AB7G88_04050 [Thermomicrobiales bacterium]
MAVGAAGALVLVGFADALRIAGAAALAIRILIRHAVAIVATGEALGAIGGVGAARGLSRSAGLDSGVADAALRRFERTVVPADPVKRVFRVDDAGEAGFAVALVGHALDRLGMAVGATAALGLIGDTDAVGVTGAAGQTPRTRIRHAGADEIDHLTAEAGILAVGIAIASAVRSRLADRFVWHSRIRAADVGARAVIGGVCPRRSIHTGVGAVAHPAGTALVRGVGARWHVDAGPRQADLAVAALGVVRLVAMHAADQWAADIRGADIVVVTVFRLAGFAETGVVTGPLGPDQPVAGIEIAAVLVHDAALRPIRYAVGRSLAAGAALRGVAFAAQRTIASGTDGSAGRAAGEVGIDDAVEHRQGGGFRIVAGAVFATAAATGLIDRAAVLLIAIIGVAIDPGQADLAGITAFLVAALTRFGTALEPAGVTAIRAATTRIVVAFAATRCRCIAAQLTAGFLAYEATLAIRSAHACCATGIAAPDVRRVWTAVAVLAFPFVATDAPAQLPGQLTIW